MSNCPGSSWGLFPPRPLRVPLTIPAKWPVRRLVTPPGMAAWGQGGGDFSKADGSGLLCCDLETGFYRIAPYYVLSKPLEVWQWEDGFLPSLVTKTSTSHFDCSGLTKWHQSDWIRLAHVRRYSETRTRTSRLLACLALTTTPGGCSFSENTRLREVRCHGHTAHL